jgi:ATPase subunit of ABC transporter with duplicated ATPase domains
MQSTDQISQIQLDSLDDTDCYASIWEQILSQDRKQSSNTNLWGGRGKGGRGLARRTIQPKDIVVEDVSLQYLGRSDAFLEGATIKLLHNHVYALIGRNGCGKSTLIKRMYSQKVPGWSSQWSSLYIPPDLSPEFFNLSPLQVIEKYHEDFKNNTNTATEARIVDLEEEMDKLDPENEQEAIEKLCAEMSILEDAMSSGVNLLMHKDKDVRDFLQNLQIDADTPCGNLEPAQQKEVLLLVASLLGDMVNLVLLDEPARNLSVRGLLRLRQLIESSSSTILMVSHDIDLINDVSTDIIDMHAQKLHYYPGNYDSYRLMKEQRSHHLLQQSVEMEKKQDKLKSTLQHLKEQPTSRRKGGATKKAKAIASHRRKMEWHKESIKKLDASSEILPERKGLTPAQRLKLAETIKTTPDKAVQFA